MLSICIPIYNFDVRATIQTLHAQVKALPVSAEIICIDDHSEEAFHLLNSEVNSLITKYIRLEKNVGRARIRNLFLNYAQHDYLLFLDCDCVIDKPDFLQIYVQAFETAPNIVCGGHKYLPNSDRAHRLRYIYGKKCEAKNAELRRKNPNKSFTTANFVIKRELFTKIHFDDTINGYGHEDTLFGFALKEANIFIQHIDNEVLIADIDTNLQFLQKTQEAIQNLVFIYDKHPNKAAFSEDISLLKAYRKLKKYHLTGFFRAFFAITKPCCRKLFSNGCANMPLFKFYKLGLLVHMISK